MGGDDDDWGKVPAALFACHRPRKNVAMVIYIFLKFILLYLHSRYSSQRWGHRKSERERGRKSEKQDADSGWRLLLTFAPRFAF